MNLYEKLNRLDDSLAESERIVEKKNLTESYDCDDDIDEMLTESEEKYELSTLVKDSINHLVNDLGKDPMADDFGDDVCADLENNYDIDVPSDMIRYAEWCNAVMSEVSRQVNKVEEQLTEGNNVSSQLPPALDAFLQDIAQMYGTITYKDIMEHQYTEEDLKRLKNYRRRFRAEIPYEGDEEADVILQNIAENVGRLIKNTSLREGFLDEKFLNNIDQDILSSLKDAAPELITNNSVKCSKSVVPNALYYVDKGEDVEFVLGNMRLPMKPITHCWIKHNGEVLQTRVPEADVKLIPKFTIMLTPNDIETSKEQIKHLILNI